MSDDLLHTRGIGAGNFFRLAAGSRGAAAGSVIELDAQYRHPSGHVVGEFTLAELDELTDRVAAGYHSDGIRAKDPVAVFLDESVRYLIHYIALTKIGAIPVFLNSLLPPDVAAEFIARVGAVAVVCDGRLDPDRLTIPVYDREPYADGPVPVYRHTDGDPVLIAHTSGTTGVPKAVQFNHGGFFYGVRQQIGADLGRRILSALPQSHGSAISVLMSGVARGCRILLVTDRAAEGLAARVQDFRPHLVAGFPRVFVDLCRLDLTAYDFDSVARWMSTGDANHERHIRKLVALGHHQDRAGQNRDGSLFIDNFGSSEFGYAMFRQVHSPDTDRYGRCIGRPFEWIDAQILADDDEPAPPGTVGRLALKSPTVTAGYWNNSLLSEQNRVHGYWLTGDLAYRDEEGRFYHVDRTADAIPTDTGTVYSTQIEELILRQVPEVFDCSLVSTSDQARQLVLSVELAAPGSDPEALRTRVNTALAHARLPEVERVVIEGVAEFTGLTGKALKRTMRDAYRPSAAAG